MRTRALGIVLWGAAASACAPAPRASTAPVLAPAPGADVLPVIGPTASTRPEVITPPSRRGPAVTMTEFQGRSSEELGTMFEPVQERLEACGHGTGGKVLIRVKREAGQTRFALEPGSSLDPRDRHCVLEALSTSNLDDTSTMSQGANVRPSGFTSLITVAW